jgi:hypothetical protein
MMEILSVSPLNRFITRPRPTWVGITVCSVLLLLPIIAISLDGAWDVVIPYGQLRPLLVAPVVIIYILVVSQLIAKNDANMVQAFRPLVMLDEERFGQLVREGSRVSRVGEGLALVFGLLFGLGLSLSWLQDTTTFWLGLYILISQGLMHSLLMWVIYSSIAGARLIALLHRQPMKIDILDIRPFEPIGRYSLALSLVFVGGITLGAIFGLNVDYIFAWQTWTFYLPFLAVPVIVFFLNMRDTHRLLATEKRRQLQIVRQKIRQVGQVLQQKLAQDEALGESAIEFNALVAYETRLQAAPTWPYNTAMLRALFFTLLLPLLVRGLSAWLFHN